MQESVVTSDWEQFKEELYDLYLGSSGEQKYSVASLQTLIEKQAMDPISMAEDLGIYHQSFLTIASFLNQDYWIEKLVFISYKAWTHCSEIRCKDNYAQKTSHRQSLLLA